MPDTAPGSELLAKGLNVCEEYDKADRCTQWKYGSGEYMPYDIPEGYELQKKAEDS